MWMKKKKISCNSLAFVIIAVFACVFSISSCNFSCSAPNAFAQEVTKSKHSSDNIIATDSITDTENLLGDSVNRVSDAIDQTKKQTGVSVRLLYISTFGNTNDPSKWASELLTSTNPAPNTLLLAVASQDGRLVVAVSSNSDEWLKRKSTVDAISDAASKALMDPSNPKWAESALAMMKQINMSKKTSTTTFTSIVSTIVMIAILIAIAIVVTLILVHKNKVKKELASGKRKPRRRHAK